MFEIMRRLFLGNSLTPTDRHERKDIEILEKRHQVYQEAKGCHPERWTGATRNWEHIGEVALNRRNNPGKNDRRREKGGTTPAPVPVLLISLS